MSPLLQQYSNTQYKEVLATLIVEKIICGGRKPNDLESFSYTPSEDVTGERQWQEMLLSYPFPPLTLHPKFNFRYRDIFKDNC